MSQQAHANAPPYGSQDNYKYQSTLIYPRQQQATPDSGVYISDKSTGSSSGRAAPQAYTQYAGPHQAWHVGARGYSVPVIHVLDSEVPFFCKPTDGRHGYQYVVLPPKGLGFTTPVVEGFVFWDYGSAKLLVDYYRDLEVGARRECAPEVRYGRSELIAEMENERSVAHGAPPPIIRSCLSSSLPVTDGTLACIEYLLTCLPFYLYAPLFADERFLENIVATEPITLSTVAIAAHVLKRFTESGKFGEFIENEAVCEQLERAKVSRWETSLEASCRVWIDMLVTNALTLGIQWCEDATCVSFPFPFPC
jgi:hypothetical protein